MDGLCTCDDPEPYTEYDDTDKGKPFHYKICGNCNEPIDDIYNIRGEL